MKSNNTLDVGDTVDVQTATNDYELDDWGEIIDGQYTYVMMGDDVEYYVAINEYEIKEVNEHD